MLINQSVNKDQSNNQLDLVFAALADPTRRSILARLSNKSATVNELAAPYDMSLPAISKHLKVLEKAGLISKSVDAQRRECHLELAQFKTASDWLDAYRQFWQNNLDSLEDYLQQIQSSKEQ